MTIGKLSLFVEADGFDSKDGTPLVRIDGEPRMLKSMTRVSNGQPDIRIRAAFDKWGCRVRIRYDREQFTPQDVGNLLLRVGMQVGLLEGRPDSTNSCGMGWGMFKLEGM